MSERWSTVAAWAAFVLLIGTAAYLSLAACDLGRHPLFGLKYCRAPERNDPLAAERERERVLLDRLYQAQLNLSRLPVCLPETPLRREPDRRAEIVPTPVPTITPTPTPSPSTTPAPSPTPDELMTIPRNVSGLKGCWQSVRGDLEVTSDDAERRLLGKVRVCYCINDDNGRGTARIIWQDGDRCIGQLRAQVSGDRLVMKHPRLGCPNGKSDVNGEEIACSRQGDSDQVTCDAVSQSDYPGTQNGVPYRRVSAEYCK
jgi:hypothetical protein